ncbi:hypothetical protein HY483_04515 [Candidatus Woesearchaeota archaeon]|nr:hypothetical protein [Candidatus Woesearchaeota archaeon]
MVEKLHAIVTSKESDVIGLRSLLFQILPEIGFNVESEGAFKSTMRGIHHEDYFITFQQERIGKYGFELKGDVYQGTLDLRDISSPMYDMILERVSLQFPKLIVAPVKS